MRTEPMSFSYTFYFYPQSSVCLTVGVQEICVNELTAQGISLLHPLTLFQGSWAGLLMETTNMLPSTPSFLPGLVTRSFCQVLC